MQLDAVMAHYIHDSEMILLNALRNLQSQISLITTWVMPFQPTETENRSDVDREPCVNDK